MKLIQSVSLLKNLSRIIVYLLLLKTNFQIMTQPTTTINTTPTMHPTTIPANFLQIETLVLSKLYSPSNLCSKITA